MHIPTGHSQVNLKFNGTGVPTGAEVTFGLDNTGSSLSALAIANLIDTNYVANLMAACNSHVELTGILVKNGPNDVGPFFEKGVAHVGANTSGDCIPNSAALVRKSTGLGGRKHRGRMFLPFLGESDMDTGGFVSSSFLSGLQGAVDDFYNQLVSDDIPMSLLHADSLTSPDAVAALTVEAQIATQRRRLRR